MDLTNLTTAMVQHIFSRDVTDWSTFGFGAATINVCMRVAGSGTQATFDAAVMHTNRVGPSIPAADDSLLHNHVFFNNTTGDMMDCINNKYGNTPNAIGFADADQCGTPANCPGAGYANIATGPIPFNGALPTAANITNGLYDRFWTLEHIFEPNAAGKAASAGLYVSGLYPGAP